MNGWAALILLVAAAVAVLWALKIRGAVLQLALATLLVGSAGYALQGRPQLSGAPRVAETRSQVMPVTGARRAFFGDFSGSEHWLIMSESLARNGRTADAVNLLKSAVREHPEDASLWVGLGNALVDHAGVITPASQLAFERARELAPRHPAPPFFMGVALARSGGAREAIALWQSVLADAPADASWRPIVEDAIAALTSTARAPAP